MMFFTPHDPFAPLREFDAGLMRVIKESFRDPQLVRAMTFLASPYAPALFVPFALIWILKGGIRAAKLAFVAGLLLAATTAALSMGVRPLVARPSPSTTALSFPSVPTANAFMLATFLSLYYLGMGSWTLVAAIGVGLSSVVAGDCFPSDALAGALFGIAIGFAAWNATRNNIGQRFTTVVTSSLDPSRSRHMSRR